jgi:RNA polymerase sigma factor (sigma-70 family)
MDANRKNRVGLVPASGEVATLSTHPVMLSAEQIYHDYAPRVYNLARRMVRSDADAEDVTQDVLPKVVRKLPTLRGASALPTWLHQITRNTALSHRRKHAVREEHRCRDPVDIVLADAPTRSAGWEDAATPEAQLVHRETRAGRACHPAFADYLSHGFPARRGRGLAQRGHCRSAWPELARRQAPAAPRSPASARCARPALPRAFGRTGIAFLTGSMTVVLWNMRVEGYFSGYRCREAASRVVRAG